MRRISLSIFALSIFVIMHISVSALSPLPSFEVFQWSGLIEFNYPGYWSTKQDGRGNFYYTGGNEEPAVSVVWVRLPSATTTKKWFKNNGWSVEEKSNFDTWKFKAYLLDDEVKIKKIIVTVKEDRRTGTQFFVGPGGVLYTFQNKTTQDGTLRNEDVRRMIKNSIKTIRFAAPFQEGSSLE